MTALHRAVLLLALLTSVSAGAIASRADGDDVAVLLQRAQVRAAELTTDELWEAATSLVSAAERLDGGELETLLDAGLRGGDATPRARLLMVAARLQGEDPDLEALSGRLVELLGTDDDEVATAAASLLEDDQFVTLGEEARTALVEALLAGAQDAARTPGFRIECATTAIERGDGAQSRAGRRELLAFLDSSDAKLRGHAALALARCGDGQTVQGELERMAQLPSAEGRLAAAILRQEEIIEHKDRQLRNLRNYFMEKLDQEQAGGATSHEARMLENLLQMVEQRHLEGDSFTRDELIAAALNGLLQRLDRHSTYMTPEEYKEFSQDLLNPEYGGIGAYVNNDPDDQLFTITRPIYSGPAYRAGLVSGDKIVRIDEWPTLGEDQEDIIKRLKGKPGTPVKLYIWKHGMDGALIDRPTEDMAVEIVRERIHIPPIQSDLLPGGVGLVELSTFSRGCAQLMRDELQGMLDQGAQAIVLDLRRNLGGLLDEARDIVDLFLEPGKVVVYTQSRVEAPEYLKTRRPALVPADVPVVVLIDRFSASASEIVSGALQDHGRALIVGQRSFGKGSVQNPFPLKGERSDEFIDENHNGAFDEYERITKDWNGNGEFDYAPIVKMTISRYMLPSGRSIHRELDRDGNVEEPGGITPDIEANPVRWPQWKLEEFQRITNDRSVRTWADEQYPQNKELFAELARSDRHDPSLYPAFDELYESLDTVLPKDDVRYLVRLEVRRRVQDDRGAAFPSGDYGEDPMLQEGIRALYDELGKTYLDVDEYAAVFELGPRQRNSKPADVAQAETREELDGAIATLDGARKRGGQLSMEEIQGLIELLHALED